MPPPGHRGHGHGHVGTTRGFILFGACQERPSIIAAFIAMTISDAVMWKRIRAESKVEVAFILCLAACLLACDYAVSTYHRSGFKNQIIYDVADS